METWLDYYSEMGDRKIMAVDKTKILYRDPHHDFVDPLKDVQKFRMLFDMGVLNPEQIAKEMGYEYAPMEMKNGDSNQESSDRESSETGGNSVPTTA